MIVLAIRCATAILLCTCLLALDVHADHFICSWHGPGAEGPTTYGFREFCTARQNLVDSLRARFVCGVRMKANRSLTGATWSLLL